MFSKTELFYNQFLSSKTREKPRSERTLGPGQAGHSRRLRRFDEFFFQVRESPSSLLSTAEGTVAKSPTEVCIYSYLPNNRAANLINFGGKNTNTTLLGPTRLLISEIFLSKPDFHLHR